MFKALHSKWALALVVLAAAVVGCGGSGGGGSTGSSSGSTGTSTFGLGARLTVNGGRQIFGVTTPQGDIPAGTQSFTLADGQGNVTAFNNVFVPITITSGFATVIRAGSQLFSGTYGSRTALCTDQSGVQVPVPLNADGTLAQDTALDDVEVRGLVLPVTAIGALTFQGGISVDVDAGNLGNNTHDVTMVFSSPSTHVPSGNNSNALAGTLSFSDGGTVNTTASVVIACSNPANSAILSLSGTTSPPSHTVQTAGQILGSSFPLTSSQLTYDLSN